MVYCLLCNNHKLKIKYVLKLDKSISNMDKFKIIKCNNCGLVFSNLLDNPEQIDSGYEEEYFSQYDISFKSNPKIRTFCNSLDLMEKIKPEKGKILDFGCAEGNFLVLAKQQGWDVCGVDLSKFAINIAKKRGLKVFNKSIYDLKFKNESFDVITLWDVIEHLSDLNGILKELRRILKKDGLLILRTPNENSIFHLIAGLSYILSFKMFKFPLKSIYHLDHLYYFSKKTLAKTLNKNGFKINKIIMNDQTAEYYKNAFLRSTVKVIRSAGIMLGKQHAMMVVATKK